MTWVWILLMAVVGFAAVSRNEIARRRARSATVSLEVDRFGMRRLLADGREERITWGDVRYVDVVRAKWGPHAPSGGVVMIGGDDHIGALVPITALGDSGVVEHLSELQGFDMEAFVEALEVRPPARLRIWPVQDDERA
ncbi:MAG: hypothetical protein JJU45_00115 [Acidimicrobiia bacterium]|nr:hypothetical protein [Acidimicrobiia bacterium]